MRSGQESCLPVLTVMDAETGDWFKNFFFFQSCMRHSTNNWLNLFWTELIHTVLPSDCVIHTSGSSICRSDLYCQKEKSSRHTILSWETIKCHCCYPQSLYRCLSISTPSDEIITSIKGSYGLISSHLKTLQLSKSFTLPEVRNTNIFGEGLELLMVGCEDL